MSIFGESFIDFLNNLLEFARLNNDFGRLLFSIVIMLVVTGFLAFLKSNGYLILLINLILFVLFASIGFFPTWTILAFSLTILILIFVVVGGGSSE